MAKTATQVRDLKICHWNLNGIKNKIQELENFMALHNIDAMLLNETKLTSSRKTPFIEGYKSFRRDRPAQADAKNPGGGVLIYLKAEIQASEIYVANDTQMEFVGVKIGSTALYSIYLPPDVLLDVRILEKLRSTSRQVILFGDFNARHTSWFCTRINDSGRRLHSYALKLRYVLLTPPEFTHYPYDPKKSPSIIDLALIKGLKNVKIEVLDELDSDHNPVLLHLNSKIKVDLEKQFLNYKKADWNRFRDLINSNLTVRYKLHDKKSIKAAISNLTNIISSALNEAIPRVKNTGKRYKFNSEVISLIRDRNKLRKTYQKTGDYNLKTQQNLLTNQIHQLQRNIQNEKWNKKLENLSTKDNSLWKFAKFFTKSNDKKIPPLKTNTGTATSDKEKADALADHYEKVHHLTKDLGDPDFDKSIDNKYKNLLKEKIITNDIKFVSPHEISRALKTTKNRKAPGPDKIQNIALKNLPAKGTVQLTNIFNACLKLSYFPKKWKTANILAFKKPNKDKSLPVSYRPISLLNTMSKIFEIIILNRFLKFENDNKILIDEQFGFRRNRSTVQQLTRIAHNISCNFNINKSTAMVLLDIEKAFDTVWHKFLIYLLYDYKLPLYLVKIIANYLKRRRFFVSVNKSKSSKRKIAAGVPQGSILGPILFIYFINAIPRSPDVDVALFADDTAASVASWKKSLAVKKALNKFLEIRNFFIKRKIQINPSKTELIIFSKKIKETAPSIKIDNQIIEPSKHVRYLGVYLDSRLNFTKHTSIARGKALGVLSSIYNLINKKSCLNTKNKLTLYKCLIRPILLYAAPVWSNTCESNYNKLEVVQNKILRMIASAKPNTTNSQIRQDLNMSSLKEEIHKQSKNFYDTQITKIDTLKNITSYNLENAPFRIKHKLPYHIHMI